MSPTSIVALTADSDSAQGLERCFARVDVRLVVVTSAADALARLRSEAIEVLVTDLRFPGGNALELTHILATELPDVPVVVMTSEPSIAEAVEALRAGALDFLLKPFVAEHVSYVLDKALAVAKRRVDTSPPVQVELGTDSKVMEQVSSLIRRAAAGSATVLVRGESGTGKELAARAIHEHSSRGDKAFVKIDCASLPETLLESELFGYEKGAFTGATHRKPGRVELAEGGTLFLDEIGELGSAVQAKLLRLLQERQIERLGGTRTIAVDVRLVAATHRDLETMIDRGQFRQDLFYRLNVIPVWLPPLRARRADIELLARRFVTAFAAVNKRPGLTIKPEALAVLRRQRWPGNVRQLQNVVERLVVLCESSNITAQDVRAELAQRSTFRTQPNSSAASRTDDEGMVSGVEPLAVEVRAAERRALVRALKHARGNRSVAARLLGISRSSFYEKLAEHELS